MAACAQVKGEMKVAIADPDMARLVVVCNQFEKLPGVQFRPHPKIDAKAWTSDGHLCLKDKTKPFPVGSENATGAFFPHLDSFSTAMHLLSICDSSHSI